MFYATLPLAVLKRIVAVHTAADVQTKDERRKGRVKPIHCVHLVGTRGVSLEVVATDGVLLVCETFRIQEEAASSADFKLNLTPENVDRLAQVLTGPSKSTDESLSLGVTLDGVTLTDSRNAYDLGPAETRAGAFPAWRSALESLGVRSLGYRPQPEAFGLSTKYLAKLSELWKSAPLSFEWNGRGFAVSTMPQAKPRGLCGVDLIDARALLMPVQV